MKTRFLVPLALVAMLGVGCEKFLEESPNKRLAVASTLQDYQALLDQHYNINVLDAAAGEVSSDDYYLSDADGARQSETDRRMYLWERENIFAAQLNDWYNTYTPLYRFNTVISGIGEVQVGEKEIAQRDNISGQAHFMRARSFFNAVQIWTKAYDRATAGSELGIPLRLNTDFNERSVRSTLAESYRQIISDLKTSVPLLAVVPVSPMRGSRPAAYGLLARVYLSMNDYGNAGLYADSCLRLRHGLLDYSTLNAAAAYPISQMNREVIFSATMNTPTILLSTYAKVSPELYDSYAATDLRKTVFFRRNTDGSFAYKGSYDGSFTQFTGISVNEQYLIRAECHVRAGRLTEGRADLNALLANRMARPFVPVATDDPAALLARILLERRKELLFRGLRWMDLKRLNQSGAGISLSRTVNGKLYSLAAGSDRFALTIPEQVIAISGMQQNP